MTRATSVAEYHGTIGSIYMRVGRLAEAIEHLTQAARLAPQEVQRLFWLATALHRAGRWEQAIPELFGVIGAAPGNIEAYQFLAHALNNSRRWEQAIEVCNRA